MAALAAALTFASLCLARGCSAGRAALAAGPVTVTSDPEYAFDRGRLDELAAVSRRSGGAERVDLSDVWRAPRPTAFQGLRRWLLPLLAAAIVLEALASRTGWSLRPARR